MRRLSLIALVFCLLAALCLPATAAASPVFSDSDRIENIGAVQMLCDLGVISGYEDGSFRPRSTVSRQAAAKMVALIMTDSPEAAYVQLFLDVPAWSQFTPYINYCYSNGIISGTNGLFYPNDPVTPRALAKMLLGALGYDSSRYTGTGWADRVDEDARAAGIYDGFYDYYDQPITRDNACLLIFNALQSYAIASYDEAGQPVYHLDELMNPQTLLEYRYGVVEYSELLIANEYADLTQEDQRLEAGFSQLAHHRALEVSTGLDMLGRYVVLYARDGEVVGVPTYSPYEGYYTFHGFIELAQMLQRVNMTIGEDAQFYYNYNASTRLELVRAGEDVEITVIDHTGDGTIDMILMTQYRAAEVVSTEDGVLHARIGESEPFEVYADSEQIVQLAEGDEIQIAWIGGRWLMKGA